MLQRLSFALNSSSVHYLKLKNIQHNRMSTSMLYIYKPPHHVVVRAAVLVEADGASRVGPTVIVPVDGIYRGVGHGSQG